jgi:hypothetical protein
MNSMRSVAIRRLRQQQAESCLQSYEDRFSTSKAFDIRREDVLEEDSDS